MKVKLMQYTPEPERTVAMAARLCYSAVGAEELAEKMSQSQVAGLVSKIVELGHLSTLEHVNFTFAVEGISRVLSHQLVRHQHDRVQRQQIDQGRQGIQHRDARCQHDDAVVAGGQQVLQGGGAGGIA